MIGIDKPFDKERPRDRFFKDDEITAIWRAADAIEGSEGRFLKLLLLTGKREGALARMRWEHIDETWFWEPPRSELANKRLHPIPYRRWRNACLVRDNNRGSCFQGLSKGRTTSMPVPCTAACDA
jgi:integrase